MGLLEFFSRATFALQLFDCGTEITDVLAMFFLAPTFVVQAIMFTAPRGCLDPVANVR